MYSDTSEQNINDTPPPFDSRFVLEARVVSADGRGSAGGRGGRTGWILGTLRAVPRAPIQPRMSDF